MVRPPYQTAVRLSATATGNWTRIDGTYAGKGVNILDLPFSRFLSVIYVWALSNQSQEDGEKWEAQLAVPLPGQPETSQSADDELAQLAQFELN